MFSGADVLFRFTFLEGLNFGCLRPPYFDSSPPPRFSLVVCCAPRALLCTMQTTCFFCEPDVFTLLVWSVCASARVKSTYGGAKKGWGGRVCKGGPALAHTHVRACDVACARVQERRCVWRGVWPGAALCSQRRLCPNTSRLLQHEQCCARHTLQHNVRMTVLAPPRARTTNTNLHALSLSLFLSLSLPRAPSWSPP